MIFLLFINKSSFLILFNSFVLVNSLLSDNLDLDFVEILIRDKFLYGKKNETTYIIENDEN